MRGNDKQRKIHRRLTSVTRFCLMYSCISSFVGRVVIDYTTLSPILANIWHTVLGVSFWWRGSKRSTSCLSSILDVTKLPCWPVLRHHLKYFICHTLMFINLQWMGLVAGRIASKLIVQLAGIVDTSSKCPINEERQTEKSNTQIYSTNRVTFHIKF